MMSELLLSIVVVVVVIVSCTFSADYRKRGGSNSEGAATREGRGKLGAGAF